jgi:hypothetical protein
MFRTSNPGRCRRLFLLLNAQTGSRAQKASCSVGTGVLSRGLKWTGRDVEEV